MTALLAGAVVSGVSVGLGCGTCCMPQTGTFLSSYIISHGKGGRTLLLFMLGKSSAIILVCLISSLLGYQLIDSDGLVAGVDIYALLQGVLIAVGVFLIVRWFRRYGRTSKRGCNACSSDCGEKAAQQGDRAKGGLHLFFIGFACGITPCAPMFLLLAQSALLQWPLAILLGAAFSLTSSFSPVLLVVLLSGLLSSKMMLQIPKWTKWFQLACYIILIAASELSIISHFTGTGVLA